MATPAPSPAAVVWRDRYALYVALLVAWVATLGSLYFSEVRHLTPCMYCWYQRILMYPMALVLLIGLLRRDEHLPYYTLALSTLGMGVSTYHYLLQKTTWFSAGTSCQGGVPCNFIDFQLFGFVTIPFMALIAFVLIFAASLLVVTSVSPIWEEGEAAARRPALGIVAAVVLAFAPAFLTAPPVASEAATHSTAAERPLLAQRDGATLYAEACAACHGAGGAGGTGSGPALLGNDFTLTTPDEAWIALVREGRPADHPDNQSGLGMPPSGGQPELTDDDLQAILSYLRVASRR